MDDNPLEDYTFLSKLGSGSFSTVYKVERDNNFYAVKIIDKGTRVQYKLEQEAQILSLFDHPNIIKYYETIESKKNLYFIIEYVDGTPLQTLMDSQQFTHEQIVFIMSQILSAVAHIHSKDIIHRDLKPDNILINDQLKVKIIDFGLSLQTQRQTSHDNCGTLLFMAPEVIQKKEYFKSIDIWSCGIIQYMLYNQRHPFFYLDNPQTYAKKLQNPEVINGYQRMPKEAIKFFQKTANIDPDSRMTAEQCLLHPWITGNSSNKILTSREIMNAFQTQFVLTKFIKALMTLSYIQDQSTQQPVQQKPHHLMKVYTEQDMKIYKDPLSFREYPQQSNSFLMKSNNSFAMKSNKSFLSQNEIQIKNRSLPKIKQPPQIQKLKLPPIKSYNNSPQNRFSPVHAQLNTPELKRSTFKFK